MTRRTARGLVITSLVLTVGMTVRAAGAQDELTGARELYASAAYDEALATLDRLRASATGRDMPAIEQYRAFCLLALGREAEAQTAIEAAVVAEPLFQPSEMDASPRVRNVFIDVRRRVLPRIVEGRYAQAKEAFDQHDYQTAASGFAQVLAILADPVLQPSASQPPLSDLRTLASGFQELSARVPVVPSPVAPTAPPIQTPLSPPAPRIYTASDPNVMPPATIRQVLPPFFGQFSESTRTLDIIIGEDGAVESVLMRGSVNAQYDKLVLSATRAWRYKPASVDGMPVKYRKTIQITIKPRS